MRGERDGLPIYVYMNIYFGTEHSNQSLLLQDYEGDGFWLAAFTSAFHFS